MLAACLFLATPALAQQPLLGAPAEEPAAAPTLPREAVEHLIATVEDPVKREELVASLQALLAAQQETVPDEVAQAESMMTWARGLIRERTSVVNRWIDEIVESVDRVPDLWQWVLGELGSDERRELWVATLMRLALIVGLGVAGYVGARLLLYRPRKRMHAARPEGRLRRVTLVAGWLIVELLPVAAFAGAAYAALTVVDPRLQTRMVAWVLIDAVVLVRGALAIGRVAFAARAPGLRLLPISDESAFYGQIWLWRLSAVAGYGYYVLEAGFLLGLPWALYGALLQLLGLLVLALVVVLILQNRLPVALAIASLGERAWLGRRLPWVRLAAVWHLLALLYVVTVYAIWSLRVPGGFAFMLRATLATLAIVALTPLVLRVVDQVFRSGFQAPGDGEAPFPGIERRANRYLPALRAVVRVAVVVGAAIAVLQSWGFGTIDWLLSEQAQGFGGALVSVGIIALVALAVWEILTFFIERYLNATDDDGNPVERTNRTRTLIVIGRNALFVVLTLIAGSLILSELGVNIAPLLAGAGVLGLAIGFGAQKLVQDIITGVFILLENTLQVGDVVEVGGKGGLVEAVTIRTIRLRDYGGVVHTIPYSSVDSVSNLTKDFSFYIFDVGVAYREDTDQVMEVMREIDEEMRRDPVFRRDILEPLEVAGVDRFADSAVIIRARIKTRPIKQWAVGREFNRRLKRRFDELGIEIPFPHQTLYFGHDREGGAPAARISVIDRTPDPPVPAAELERRAAPQAVAEARG